MGKTPQKHSPGPWKVSSDAMVVSADGACILLPAPEENCDEEAWANARLIAAAPDMLDLLRRAVNRDGVSRNDLSEILALLKRIAVLADHVKCSACNGKGWFAGDCHPQEACGLCDATGFTTVARDRGWREQVERETRRSSNAK